MPTEIEHLLSESDDLMTEEQIERAIEDQILNDYMEQEDEHEEGERDFYSDYYEDHGKMIIVNGLNKEISEVSKVIEKTIIKNLGVYHPSWGRPDRLSDPELSPIVWASGNHYPNS